MKKTILKHSKKILTIIFVTLTFITMLINKSIGAVQESTTANDVDYWIKSGQIYDSGLAKLAVYGTKGTSDTYFNFSSSLLITQNTVKCAGGTPYHRVGEYCIDSTNTQETGGYQCVSIIDIHGDKMYLYRADGKGNAWEYGDNAKNALRAMAYASIKSINNNEQGVSSNSWKATIESIISQNISNFNLASSLNVTMLGKDDMNRTASKRQEAMTNSRSKTYRARFIFLYGPKRQNQIIFGAKEVPSTEDGVYNLELEKTDENGNTITNASAEFAINGETKKTTNGKAQLVTNKTINNTEKDTYYISETKAPTGYAKLAETIKIDIAKKVVNNKYQIDRSNTTVQLINQNGKATNVQRDDYLTIDESSGSIKIKVKNNKLDQKYRFSIQKEDLNGNIIASPSKFMSNYYGIADTFVLTKGIAGYTYDAMNPANHEIQETQAPEGYEKTKGSMWINISRYNNLMTIGTVLSKEAYLELKDLVTIEINGNKHALKDICNENDDFSTEQWIENLTFDDNSGIALDIIVHWKNKKSPNGKYNVSIEKVDNALNTITNGNATFNVQGGTSGTTSAGKLNIVKNKEINSSNVSTKDVYTITETKAPSGYELFNGKLELTVAKKQHSEGNYIIDKANTTLKITRNKGQTINYTADDLLAVDEETGEIKIYVPNQKEAGGKYSVNLVKVDENDSTIDDTAKFNVGGKSYGTVDGYVTVVDEKEITKSNVSTKDVYEIEETQAPKNYAIFNGKIKLIVAKKISSSGDSYVIDTENTKIEAVDSNGNAYTNSALQDSIKLKINTFTGTITLEIKNYEDKAGEYNVDVVKVDENGNSIQKTTKFSIDGSEKSTSTGTLSVVSKKQVTNDNWNVVDKYTIKETSAPDGYEKFDGTIELSVYKKEANGAYIVDTSKTTVKVTDAKGNEMSNPPVTVNKYTGGVTIKVKNTKKAEEPDEGNLKIIKVDKDDHTIKLANVSFKIKENKRGYINKARNGAITFVTSESQATTFKTDNNGEISVYGLPTGDYTIYETSNPNENYVSENTTKSITISKGNTTTVTIENTKKSEEPKDGNVKIVKVDKDDHTIKLANVGFKIKNNSTGKYVKQARDGTITYVEEANATEFVTDKNGEIYISGLSAGNYTIYETKNPNSEYKNEQIEKVITIYQNATGTVTIENAKKDIGNLKIIKVDKENHSTKLAGVGFKIKESATGKYVNKASDGTITYVTESQATEFVTDKNGEILIEGLKSGKYLIYETVNPNEKYELDKTAKTAVVSLGNTTSITIENVKKDIGDLKIIKVDQDNNSKRLASVKFKVKSSTTGQYVKQASTGEISYVTESQATIFVTNSNGEILIEGLKSDKYLVYEIENNNANYIFDKTPKTAVITRENVTTVTVENYRIKLGNIKFIKVVKGNTNIKLSNFSFKIEPQSLDLPSYANTSEINQKYNTTRTFTTNSNGEATLTNLPLGTYKITEISTGGNKYFKIGNTITVKVTQEGKTITQTMENEISYADISGFVWKDYIAGKKSEKNDRYDQNEDKIEGIKVVLKNGNTEVKNTTTNSNGEYKFELVPIETIKSSELKVEFTFNGMIYESVTPNISKNITNASRAKENAQLRNQTNKQYSTQEAGQKVTSFNMTADTKTAGCTLADYMEISTENGVKAEIKNMNLGLGEREQPDLAILKDVLKSQVSINGKTYTYNYADRFKEPEDLQQSEWTVEFKSKFTNSYTQPIYPSDIEYTGSDELKVYVIYKIAVKNDSTSLSAKVGSIVDYYDSDYNVVKVGTGVDGNEITGELKWNNSEEINANGNTYRKMTIYPSQTIIKHQSVMNDNDSIYVKFEIGKNTVSKIMNNNEALDNVVEINSQTYFSDENGQNLYAGFDKDSTPGNYNITTQTPSEDDTDKAPLFKLSNAGTRTIEGMVFEDNKGVSSETKVGEERKGNGTYDIGEPGIKNVTVRLVDSEDNSKIFAETTTDENGKYTLSNFVPGNYKITYIWGDSTYNANEYKSTIYPNKDRQNDEKWYKKDSQTRYQDAMDNYDTRTALDNQNSQTIDYSTTINDTDKMDSSTPKISIEVENTEGTETDASKLNSSLQYDIENIDFGIIERPRQQIIAEKEVSNVKLNLANGQELLNVDIDENGIKNPDHTSSAGQTKGSLTYLNGNPGNIKIETDDELIQGSVLKITYVVKAKNNSELDYNTKEYYLYGEINGEQTSKMKALGIIDYMDKGLDIETQDNTWIKITKDELKNGISGIENSQLVSEEVYKSTGLDSKVLLYTKALANEELQIGQTSSTGVKLSVSGLLANKDEISVGNDVEIVKIHSDTPRKLHEEIPGNYDPAKSDTREPDDDQAPPVNVVPNTGGNGNKNVIIAGISIASLAVIAVGIVIIKKKIL